MPSTFRDLIAENQRKSTLLVLGFVLFVLFLSALLGSATMILMDPGAPWEQQWHLGLVVGLGVAAIQLGMSFIGYFAGDSLILATSGAKLLEKHDDPQLFNVVEEMAIAAGVPMPRIYFIDDSAPNAFATGRDPEHASVTITRGLREKLKRDELQGVIAHEMSHVRNYDIRLMLLVTILIGSVVMMTDLFWYILRSRNTSQRSNRDGEKDSSGPIVIVVLALAILFEFISPILAQLIQMAVSRQREYLADASAAELTRNPLGLANALRKIDADPDDLQSASRGTAHLFIANPIKKFQGWSNTLFASHPPIKDRIARLEALVIKF